MKVLTLAFIAEFGINYRVIPLKMRFSEHSFIFHLNEFCFLFIFFVYILNSDEISNISANKESIH